MTVETLDYPVSSELLPRMTHLGIIGTNMALCGKNMKDNKWLPIGTPIDCIVCADIGRERYGYNA
jgi:hypothetical protein